MIFFNNTKIKKLIENKKDDVFIYADLDQIEHNIKNIKSSILG